MFALQTSHLAKFLQLMFLQLRNGAIVKVCMRLLLTHLLLLLVVHSAQALGGRVMDSTTAVGIPDATVTVGNYVIKTDQGGHFQTTGTAKIIFARAPGYRAATCSAEEIARNGGEIQLEPFKPKALYLSVYGIGSKPLRDGALALIRNGSLNSFVIDIKGDRGLVPYPSAARLAKTVGVRKITTIPDLGALVRKLHSEGIYAIARIVVFKDNPLAAARPDLAVKYSNGGLFRDPEGLAWTDPFQTEVRNYNIAIAVEAGRAGFDEIQFDYVRFPDAPRPLRFAQSATASARVEAIESFLTEARRQLIPFNVYLAVDVFGYVCWNTSDTGIGQQLEGIMTIVDYLSPMLYPSCFQFGIPNYKNSVAYPYQIIRLTLENAQHRLNISPKRFRPWIQAFRDYAFDRRAFGAEQVNAQVRAATDFGSDGWMLWNPQNRYTGIGLDTSGPPATGQETPK